MKKRDVSRWLSSVPVVAKPEPVAIQRGGPKPKYPDSPVPEHMLACPSCTDIAVHAYCRAANLRWKRHTPREYVRGVA